MTRKTTNRERLMRKAETLTESEIEEVVEYINIMESLKEQRTAPDPLAEMIWRLLSESMSCQ